MYGTLRLDFDNLCDQLFRAIFFKASGLPVTLAEGHGGRGTWDVSPSFCCSHGLFCSDIVIILVAKVQCCQKFLKVPKSSEKLLVMGSFDVLRKRNCKHHKQAAASPVPADRDCDRDNGRSSCSSSPSLFAKSVFERCDAMRCAKDLLHINIIIGFCFGFTWAPRAPGGSNASPP